MSIDTPALNKIWLPSNEREPHFDIPTKQQLERAWGGEHSFLALDERIYGVAQQPSFQPRAIISVDLCEVVRVAQHFGTVDTFAAIHRHLIDRGVLPQSTV